MPRWDYFCNLCEVVFERAFFSHREATTTIVCCPNCDKPAQRMFGAPAFKLKGKGFHVNDYPRGRR